MQPLRDLLVPTLMDVAFNDNGGDLLAGAVGGTRCFVLQLCRWAQEQAACFQEGGVCLLLQGCKQPPTHPPDPTPVLMLIAWSQV